MRALPPSTVVDTSAELNDTGWHAAAMSVCACVDVEEPDVTDLLLSAPLQTDARLLALASAAAVVMTVDAFGRKLTDALAVVSVV